MRDPLRQAACDEPANRGTNPILSGPNSEYRIRRSASVVATAGSNEKHAILPDRNRLPDEAAWDQLRRIERKPRTPSRRCAPAAGWATPSAFHRRISMLARMA